MICHICNNEIKRRERFNNEDHNFIMDCDEITHFISSFNDNKMYEYIAYYNQYRIESDQYGTQISIENKNGKELFSSKSYFPLTFINDVPQIGALITKLLNLKAFS